MKPRTASGTPIATATPMTARCAVTPTPRATIAAPPSAPATVPMLKPAWKRGMIARPRRRSTSAPWTFIATSQLPVPTPKANRPATTGATPLR